MPPHANSVTELIAVSAIAITIWLWLAITLASLGYVSIKLILSLF